MPMQDDSLVKIVQSLGLNYKPAENSIKSFEGRIAALNKQLFDMKANAIQGARDINQAFSSQLGSLGGGKTILDQFGQPLKTIQTEATKTGTGIVNSFKPATEAAKEHNKTVQDAAKQYNIFGNEMQRRTSWFLTGTLFYGSIKAAKEAISTISDVEFGMTEIARVMEDSTFVFKDYRDQLLQLGIDYGQTFETVQNIAMRWAQSGYNVKDSLELTRTSLLALNTAELDAKYATEGMIGIMSQWQLTAKDLLPIIDKINKTADDYAVTSQDLVDGLLRSSGAAKIMNLSIEETISLLTIMREASGRTGREVGNALNSILSYIQRPGSIKVFESMGIKVFADEARTQFRNVMGLFEDIQAKWQTTSAAIQDGFIAAADDAGLFNEELATALGLQEQWNDLQQRDIAQAAAGVYRRNYFIGMIERLANAQGVLNNMMDAAGYSQRENERTMDTLEKKYQSLQTAAQQLAVALGDAGLLNILKGLTDAATNVASGLAKINPEMKALVTTALELLAAAQAIKSIGRLFGIDATLGAAIGALPGWSKLLVIIPAVAGAIALYANNVKAAANESLINSSKILASQLEEKNNVESLIGKYESLKAKVSLTEEEQQNLKSIVNELVQIYPHLTSAINDTSGALDYQIGAIKRLNEAQKQSLLQQTKINIAKTQAEIKQYGREYADISTLITESIDLANRMNKIKSWAQRYQEVYRRPPTESEIPVDILEERVSSKEIEAFYNKNKKLIDEIMTHGYFQENISDAIDKIIMQYSDKASEILQKQATLEENRKLLERIIRGEFDTSRDLSGSNNITGSGSGSDSISDSFRDETKEALQSALRLLEHKKRMNQISIEDEIKYLKQVELLYVQTGEERMDIAERIYNAEKALLDKRLKDSTDWIREKKALDQLSAQEEIAAWNRVLRNQKDNLEAVKEATLNLHRLEKELRKDSIESYKDEFKKQQDSIKEAYNERIDFIKKEAEEKKKAQEEIIRGIEDELKAMERKEKGYDHDQKIAELEEKRRYHEVRTGEEHRKAIVDIDKQIAEENRSYQQELIKQDLEDKKQAARDEIDNIEETAKKEKEKWETAYKNLEKAFDSHNINIVTMAAATSKEAYNEWINNYLIPMQNALKSGNTANFETASKKISGSIESLPTHDWDMSDSDYNKMMTNKSRWWELYNAGQLASTSEEMQRLNAENDTIRRKYNRDISLGEYPKFHQGAKTLSYGMAMFKPGELVFPPDLSTKLESLISVLNIKPAQQLTNTTNDRRVILQGPLFNSERTVFEDDTDMEGLARELKHVITAMR